jgi:hypothetical protein
VRSRFRVPLVALLACALIAVLATSVAQAGPFKVGRFIATNCKFGFEKCGGEEFEGPLGPTEAFYSRPKTEITEAEAKTEGFTQAGGRVPYGVTDFEVATTGTYPDAVPNGIVNHVRVDVATGLATAPVAVPTCSLEEFGAKEAIPGTGFYAAPTCKAETEIGSEQVTVYLGPNALGPGVSDLPVAGKTYNLAPSAGLATYFGAALKFPIAVSKGSLEAAFAKEPLKEPATEPAKKDTEVFLESQQYYVHSFVKGNVEWGQQPAGTDQGDYHDYFEVEVSPQLPLVSSRQVLYGTSGEGDFITNATSCPGDHTTYVTLKDTAGETANGSFPTPIGLTGCGEVPFEPTFALSPEGFAQDEPVGFTTETSLSNDGTPGSNDPTKLASSQMETASFALPEGMTLNPSAAAGLEACSPKQARINSPVPGTSCPAKSEIGTVELETPTLKPKSLTGKIYLGGPESGSASNEGAGPITGPSYTIYLDVESAEYGISVRLKGTTTPNPETGQVTTVFEKMPEQPFTKAILHFNGGPLAPVASPLTCGAVTATGVFTPYSETGIKASVTKPFAATGCPSTIPFAPEQSTSNQTAVPAANTSFTFNLVRRTGQQYLSKVSTTLPEGLAGKIPAAEQCSEAAANSEEMSACPEGSRIGTAVVQAGAGFTPYTFSGAVYLTGPYNGAPYGLSIKVPAVAGPFNLGNQVTRATINLNQYTGAVTIASTLPTIRRGVPLRVRQISVAINKQGFMVNPTSCNALTTESTLSGFTTPGGPLTTATVKSPFQLANCTSLAFAPKFVAKAGGKTSKANGASLETTLNFAAGQSNTKSVLVQLPKALPSRLTTLQKACLAATFEANPYSCPSGSFVGSARANTPLLPGKLQGPAILVSHGGEAFPDLELVLEANGVRIILDGKTNIKKGITTTDFKTTPDAPVSSVTVVLPTGPHSALTTEKLTTNLCTTKLVMPTTITAQSGKVFKQNTIIQPTGCAVQIVGHKVVGNTAYVTVKTFAAGRISGGGHGLSTIYRKLSAAKNAVSLKIPLSGVGRRKGRPFKLKVRVGFVPKKKGANAASYDSASFVTVSFR